MVKAIIDINDATNRTLNVIKAEYGLRTKSEAIDKMAALYLAGDPEVRPEYWRKLMKGMKEKPIPIGTLEKFDRRYGISTGRHAKIRQEMAKAPALAAKRNKR